MSARRTILLSVLVLLAALCAALAYGRMTSLRDQASIARADVQMAMPLLDELKRLGAIGAPTPATGRANPPEIAGRIREAASAAGAGERLVGIDPGNPSRLPEANDYVETLVFLRLEAVTLRQLTTFLHGLAQAEPSSRTNDIELAASTQSPGSDTWDADVTLAYLNYSPQSERR